MTSFAELGLHRRRARLDLLVGTAPTEEAVEEAEDVDEDENPFSEVTVAVSDGDEASDSRNTSSKYRSKRAFCTGGLRTKNGSCCRNCLRRGNAGRLCLRRRQFRKGVCSIGIGIGGRSGKWSVGGESVNAFSVVLSMRRKMRRVSSPPPGQPTLVRPSPARPGQRTRTNRESLKGSVQKKLLSRPVTSESSMAEDGDVCVLQTPCPPNTLHQRDDECGVCDLTVHP